MESGEKVPRDCLPVAALNPYDGKTWNLLLRQAKLEFAAKRGMGAAKELAYTVREVVAAPSAVFRGVREEGEEDWLCYVGLPDAAYDYRTGEKRRPWPGQVFLIFVDDERIIYNWRWDKADRDHLDLPENHATRFTRRVFG